MHPKHLKTPDYEYLRRFTRFRPSPSSSESEKDSISSSSPYGGRTSLQLSEPLDPPER